MHRNLLPFLLAFLTLSACSNPAEEEPDVDLPASAGPQISPLLVGNNVWLNPSETVWTISTRAGLKLVRIGGIAYDNNVPSITQLTDWVNRIKTLGAEPMIQVSRRAGPDAAAAIVKHFNVDTGNRVTYWNIGNEPHCGENTLASAQNVASYVKEIAPAMKAVDPTIRIFAPDECDLLEAYYALLLRGDDSATDISGKVPGQAYYYVDGISWHRYIGYPPANLQIGQLTTAGFDDFLDRIQTTRELIDRANTAQGRIGADVLEWGIGEFNSSDGARVCSFENGQMFGRLYGAVMKYGGTYAATWSMFENGGSCSGTDYSYLNSDMTPRSSFYHMQIVSDNFTGYYLDGSSNTTGIRGYGAIDLDEGRISVLLMNIDTNRQQTCTVRLAASTAGTDTCQLHIPAEVDTEYEQSIDSQTSVVLVFDLKGELTRTITYSRNEQWSTGTAPVVVDSP